MRGEEMQRQREMEEGGGDGEAETSDGCEVGGGSAVVRVSAYGLNVRVQCIAHCRFCSVRKAEAN